jgi:adenine-specific DNA-methyltransferase
MGIEGLRRAGSRPSGDAGIICPLLNIDRFPKTRYQGSKRKLLGALADVLLPYDKGTAIDLYSGSGSVTLLLRHLGFQVISNDYLKFANNTARVFLEATPERLRAVNWPARLEFLLRDAPISERPLVREGFRGVFFTDEENLAIDRFCQNVRDEAPFPRAVLTYAVGQALLMKRPYNLFHRANLYMRLSSVKRSFGNATTWAKPIEEHARKAIDELLAAPFLSSSKGHEIINVNVAHLESLPRRKADLVYVDPPYIAATGKAIDYADFYHFLEGLIDYSLFAGGESARAHRPIFRARTRWVSRDLAVQELRDVANAWPEAAIVMSYRDDGIPSAAELRRCLSIQDRRVNLRHLGTYKYALSRSVTSREILLTAEPALNWTTAAAKPAIII